jgi:hypothetical protein
MSRNSLYVLNIYNHEGTYVFDDPQVDLVREPFVMGMPEIIEHQMGGGPIDTFTAIFSAAAFPGHNTVLKRLHAEYGGTWYELSGTRLEGWLCPALFKYFEVAPETLYIQFKDTSHQK